MLTKTITKTGQAGRNSSIEFIKVLAIIMIVLSHSIPETIRQKH